MASQITRNLIIGWKANIKENIKAPYHAYYWPFMRVIHQSLVDSPHKGPVMQKAFPCHDVIMVARSCLHSNGHEIADDDNSISLTLMMMRNVQQFWHSWINIHNSWYP